MMKSAATRTTEYSVSYHLLLHTLYYQLKMTLQQLTHCLVLTTKEGTQRLFGKCPYLKNLSSMLWA